MKAGPVAGLLGTVLVGLLVFVGVGGIVDIALFGAPEPLLEPMGGTLAVVVAVVSLLVLLGARSKRWLANPYW